MRTLVCGSLAFDTIMVFPDRFARHILPDQTHMLSVAFQISDMRREWGGCAGNIAYNLQGIGGSPVVMGTLGHDGGAYRDRFASLSIATDGLAVIDDAYTAQAFIITDLDDNQITAFHPGAMNSSHVNRVADVRDIGLGIVAPDGKEGMHAHAAQFAAARIPFLFDPGQGLPLFSGPELGDLIELATYLAVNDYEAKLLSERTGWSIAEIAERVDALIVTMGGEGSVIHADGATYAIPAVRPAAIVDPTGCGDAYRAGLLYGIAQGWDWEATGNLASVMGALKIASRGGQNHAVARDRVAALHHEAFGTRPW
ncbi:MAG: carbohydrate kinase family protein [Betaproteobacteria bacterium]|nr:carbohydrate kinase family protein [Betaproteobacteria bacterium]MDE2003747.1 carbohydrate kinase family protein [Betaproteobacteria bacterium]MDE2210850.1 carbohydrate kinase family protein [Betaproteobacteria bacterium]